MPIIITPGETALIAECQKLNIPFTTENLLIGDAHIRKGDKTEYIIERKAKGDLDASIKDGRYKDQKSRLVESGISRDRIVYVIEQLSKPRDARGVQRVWSSMCNSQHRDGFRVFCTKNAGETARYLDSLEKSVMKFESIVDSDTTSDVNINIKK